MKTITKHTYGYSATDYAKFKKYAWLMLISFSMLYLFFYNGRQNINLVKTDMAAAFGFFKADGTPVVEWRDSWTLDYFDKK